MSFDEVGFGNIRPANKNWLVYLIFKLLLKWSTDRKFKVLSFRFEGSKSQDSGWRGAERSEGKDLRWSSNALIVRIRTKGSKSQDRKISGKDTVGKRLEFDLGELAFSWIRRRLDFDRGERILFFGYIFNVHIFCPALLVGGGILVASQIVRAKFDQLLYANPSKKREKISTKTR